MLIFQIIITFTLLGMAFDILTKPGELLQGYVRYFNESNYPQWVIKLFTCPYCLMGQMTFSSCMYFGIFENKNPDILICVPVVIILVFHYTQSNKIK